MISSTSTPPAHVDHAAGVGEVTIAAVPAAHPYVRKATAAPGIRVLPDPAVPGAPEGVWWPPVILDPAWISRNRATAQVLHIHFGTESFPPGHLSAVIDAAHAAGWRVVFTAHDLEHPQARDQEAYRAQLDELIVGADSLITLTPGAARAIRARWGRDAQVIAHPSVLRVDAATAAASPSGDMRIGVHLKDLRPNVDGPGTVATLLEAVGRLNDDGIAAVAEVRIHHRVRDPAARDEVWRLCATDDRVTLIEHERLSDDGLTSALSGLDACVLPYRHGSHSGWLELCWDLGVPVAAPLVGFYAEQHDDGSVATFAARDAAALASALREVVTAPGATRAGTTERAALVNDRRAARRVTDAAIAAAHADLYRRLVAGGAA